MLMYWPHTCLITYRANSLAGEGNPRMFLQIRKFYMELSILLSSFNYMYAEWMARMESFIMVVVTMNATIGILFFNPRGIFTAVVAFPLLLHFIRASGTVYEESEESLKCWRSVDYHNHKLFAKFRRSCRPLRIKFGSFFHADRSLALTVVTTVFSQTANLVLTFSQK